MLAKEKNALSLLGVCRQIYAEAALIPFEAGIFKAMYPRDISLWLNLHGRAAREAIKVIYLADGVWTHRTLPAFGWASDMKNLLPRLPGLTRIVVSNHCMESDARRIQSVLEAASSRERNFTELMSSLAKDVEVDFERRIEKYPLRSVSSYSVSKFETY